MIVESVRRLPFPVRPRRYETRDSYSRRLLARNLESEEHRRERIRDARLGTDLSAEDTWRDLLPRLAGRDLRHLEPGDKSTADGVYLPSRVMCVLCAHGAFVEQLPHFDSPVCVRHRRWVGVFGDREHQRHVGGDAVHAAVRLGRLIRRRRVDARLYRTVAAALTTATGTEVAGEHEREVFEDAVGLMAAVTTKDFALKFFDPAQPWHAAYTELQTVVESILQRPAARQVRILWLYLRPTAAHLRARILQQEANTGAGRFAHDYPLTPWVLARYGDWRDLPQPHSSYLVASRDTVHTAYETGLEVERIVASEDGKPVVEVICARGHIWARHRTVRASLRKAPRCPSCPVHLPTPGKTDLATTHPGLASSFDYRGNNGLSAWDIKAGSSEIYWWICASGHRFDTTASNRTSAGVSCRYCNGRDVLPGYNDLWTTAPHIAIEWHPENLDKVSRTSSGSNRPERWLCSRGHDEIDRVRVRVNRGGCDTCRKSVRAVPKNNLAVTHPEVAALWHPTENGDLLPIHITHGSREQVVWICDQGHAWKGRIDRKVAGYKCGPCSHRELRVGVNDIATLHPVLATEWHPWRNNLKEPADLMPGTDLHWWRCTAAGHDYRQSVPNRLKAGGCPDCPRDIRILPAR